MEGSRSLFCSHDLCLSTAATHRWGRARAVREGWLFEGFRRAWCPVHVPLWVARWRHALREDEMDVLARMSSRLARPEFDEVLRQMDEGLWWPYAPSSRSRTSANRKNAAVVVVRDDECDPSAHREAMARISERVAELRETRQVSERDDLLYVLALAEEIEQEGSR